MITIIENKNFVEGIFQTKDGAEKYLSSHPKRENCEIKELSFDFFPFYMLETDNGFRYTCDQNEVIVFFEKQDIRDVTNPENVVFNLYRVTEPFRSLKYDDDRMGIIEHYHITKERIEEYRADGISSSYFGQFDNVLQILQKNMQNDSLGSRIKTEIEALIELCKKFEDLRAEQISDIYNIGGYTKKEDPVIALIEKDREGEEEIVFSDWHLSYSERKPIRLNENDWIIKIKGYPQQTACSHED
jgi:hypothetical protein